MFDKKVFFKGLVKGLLLTTLILVLMNLPQHSTTNYGESTRIVFFTLLTVSTMASFSFSSVISAVQGFNHGAGFATGYAIAFVSEKIYSNKVPFEFYQFIILLLAHAAVIYLGAKIGERFYKKSA